MDDTSSAPKTNGQVDHEMVRLARIVMQGDYDQYVLRSDPEARQRMAARLLAWRVLTAAQQTDD